MKLQNRFKEEDKLRVWVDHPYCVLCKSNKHCSLHHINGCKEDHHRSIYNSSMLCNRCHAFADGHNTDSPQSLAFRCKLLRYTYDRVELSGHQRNIYDTRFLRSVKGCV